MGNARLLLFVAALVSAVVAAAPVGAATGVAARPDTFVVVYKAHGSLAAARIAVRAAGGVLVRENTGIGVATASSVNPRFATDVMRSTAIAGVTRDRVIARNDPDARPKRALERVAPTKYVAQATARRSGPAGPAPEPLADRQWDMAQIRATSDGSYRKELGDRGVLAGILDSGIDGTHPDLAPNFDEADSRNFVTDIPAIDGACEVPSCVDPVNVDDNGHGTHVAGIVGAALNGLGTAGVAPNVTLVNIRVGQDSGYIFLQPAVDALTYAGDLGVDVVNMSFYIDPWLYNCASNPADSPAQQLEQQTVVEATNRALHYAKSHGVTLVAALGNEHTNLDNPTTDNSSPDYPPGTNHPRTVDNSCLNMPVEGKGVIGVSSTGPTTTKADYSNWSLEQNDVAAPGGYQRDNFGTPQYNTVGNTVLSTYPEAIGRRTGRIRPDGTPATSAVVRDCQGTPEVCAYYQYLQGTSMASPHAAGVVALIVSRWGRKDKEHGGLTMSPFDTEKVLWRTAADHPCPDPPVLTYQQVNRPTSYNATCEGKPGNNSIWGQGIVDAFVAVTDKNG